MNHAKQRQIEETYKSNIVISPPQKTHHHKKKHFNNKRIRKITFCEEKKVSNREELNICVAHEVMPHTFLFIVFMLRSLFVCLSCA